jgi:hypothetical protein
MRVRRPLRDGFEFARQWREFADKAPDNQGVGDRQFRAPENHAV